MSTYVPFNSFVFFAAFNGAVAGLLGESVSLSAGRGTYTSTLAIAGAYAEAVDTAWAVAANPDVFEQGVIFDFSSNYFSANDPQGNPAQTTAATYTPLANSLLAILADGETFLGTLGITPGPIAAAANNEMDVANGTIAAPGANPVSYIYACAIVTAQETGVFDVNFDIPWNSGTNGDVVTLAIIAEGWSAANWAPIKATGKIALAQATAIGTTGSGVGGAVNGGNAPGLYTATAGGTAIAPTVTGAAPTSTTVDTGAYPCLTGLLTANGMQRRSGKVVARLGSGNAEAAAGFAIGSPVMIKFLVSATNTVTMTGAANLQVAERTAQ